jgi:hypothetical protein
VCFFRLDDLFIIEERRHDTPLGCLLDVMVVMLRLLRKGRAALATSTATRCTFVVATTRGISIVVMDVALVLAST